MASVEELEAIVSVLAERLRFMEQIVNTHIGLDSRQGAPHPSQKVDVLEFAPGLWLSYQLAGPTDGHVLTADSTKPGGLKWAAGGGGGGISDGDKGDITVTGGGATWTIDPDVVTFAKMQNIGTDRLIGRDSAGAGDPEELTVGGGLEFTGSGGIQRSALTGDVTASAGSNATTIANDAVTFAKMQNLNAARIIGRRDASSGDPEELSAASPLQISGTQLQFDQNAALGNNARVTVRQNSGANVGTRRRLNFIEGANITITAADDSTDEEIDITIAASGGSQLSDPVARTGAFLSVGTNYRFCALVSSATLTTLALTAGRCYFVPFIITEQVTVTLLAFSVSTAAAGTAELAIYDDDASGLPGSRLMYVSGLDTGTTGVKSGAVNVTLQPGLYWSALRSSAACTVRASGNLVPLLWNGTTGSVLYLYTSDASLPSFRSSALTAATGSAPLIGARW